MHQTVPSWCAGMCGRSPSRTMFVVILHVLTDVLLFFTRMSLCTELDLCALVRVAPGCNEQRCELKISAFKQHFYLNVAPDAAFLAPGEAHGESGVRTLRRCFYSGHVNSDPTSSVALSLCAGTRGGFYYHGMEYAFHPLQNVTTRWSPSHLIHRRRRNSISASTCAVTRNTDRTAVWNVASTSPRRGTARSRRFASHARFVEVFVVADESMARFHGDDLRHYILTLMAVAAKLYRHPSIQNLIDIVVVEMLVIQKPEEGPKISSNAALTLRNFCAWQHHFYKTSGKSSRSWDTAILFTKQDLCGATTCDTLGMADVGTMCDPKRSCSVIEDDGLPAAFTAAHELGHVLNMPHDNNKACEDTFGKLKDNHMMTPTIIQIDRSNPWSVCSASIVTDFLDSGHGDCLLNEPLKPLDLPAEPPGLAYGLIRQCELAFGSGSKPCPYMQACAKLWCTGRAGGHVVCQTRHFPWADGTSCGNNKTCHGGTCTIKDTSPKLKVDGQWGKWGAYGTCSRTCGGGVQLVRRDCDNPLPENGGQYCHGLRVKYRSCDSEPCKHSGKSFREEQCESFNNISLKTNRLGPSVVWLPKYSGVSPKDRCKLICRANGTGYFYVLAPKVVDGTLCSPESSALCIQGRCVKAGCDGRLNSSLKFDKCGVCAGTNQNCLKVSGVFTRPINGYNFVVTLPIGASSIDIRQRGYKGLLNDDNYLAVKNLNGQYLLNGNYVVSAAERDIAVKGSLLRYTGTSTSVEMLKANRPLQEPLIVEVLSVGKMTPPRVRYSYYLTKDNRGPKILKKEERKQVQNSIITDPDEAGFKSLIRLGKWTVSEWDGCSVSCGNGFQKRLVKCLDVNGDADCDQGLKPSAIRVCGEPCPVWSIGEWSSCSRSCGKGFSKRIVHCVSHAGQFLPRVHCSGRRKPQELDFCTVRSC